MVYVYDFPLHQLTHKARAQGGANRPIYSASVIFQNVSLNLLCNSYHVGENCAAAVKTVVIDAY